MSQQEYRLIVTLRLPPFVVITPGYGIDRVVTEV